MAISVKFYGARWQAVETRLIYWRAYRGDIQFFGLVVIVPVLRELFGGSSIACWRRPFFWYDDTADHFWANPH